MALNFLADIALYIICIKHQAPSKFYEPYSFLQTKFGTHFKSCFFFCMYNYLVYMVMVKCISVDLIDWLDGFMIIWKILLTTMMIILKTIGKPYSIKTNGRQRDLWKPLGFNLLHWKPIILWKIFKNDMTKTILWNL